MITAPIHPIKAAAIVLCLCLYSITGYTQFDTQFWMPPIWDGQSANLNGPSELFISTPFPNDVAVHIETADGTTFVFDGVVSSGNPLIIPLTPAVGQTDTPNAILETGLLITSEKPIQAVHKVAASNNQSLVTLKGQNGIGRDFWCGSQVRNQNLNYTPEEYHFISVMALENNTTITIETPFAMAANGGGDLSNPVVIQLNANDSYLIRTKNPLEHVAGAHVTSDKDIVVISGSTHTRIAGGGAADAGTDQLVPVHLMGNSFVVIKGDNGAGFDYAFVVATEDNTEVFIDGGATPVATINAGEFYDYTLTGSLGDATYISTNNTVYCYHVTGASQDDEVGMSCIPQIECTGSRYIEFSKFTTNVTNQIMNFIVSDEAEPTFTINGDLYSDITGIITSTIPNLPGWVAVTVPDALLSDNNVASSEGFFHAGFLTGQGATGTYGFLSGFDDAFEFMDPNEDLPTTVYVVDSVCQGEQYNHCLHVFSCADDHNIIDFEGNEGNIVVNPGLPGFAFDTCFQYTAPFNFTGNDTITFTVDNRFGFEGDVDVIFYVVDPDTPIDAGPVQQLCSMFEGTLSAVNPDPLVAGYWQSLGGSAVIADVNSPTTAVTNLQLGTNTFIWTQDYGCEVNIDITQIIVYDGTAPPANAGVDGNLCSNNTSFTLNANDPGSTATGTWEIIQGNGTIFNINNPNAPITNLAIGENIIEWNIENGPCPGGETSDQISLFVFDENHPAAEAGDDQEFCDIDFTSAMLTGTEPIFPATGEWTLVSGTGTIVSPNDYETEVTGCDVGVNTFRWTITNGACGELIDEVSILIFNSELGTPNAGPDASYCTPTTSHDLSATVFSLPTTGTWTVEEGAGTFSDINDPNATVSNLQVGTNILRWTMNNGPCANDGLFDEITVTIFDNTQAAAQAGEDQAFCSDAFVSGTLEATPVDFPASGSWSVISGSGNFTDNTDPNTGFDGLSLGENVFRWTVDNGPCGTSTTDDVVITLFDINDTAVNAGDDASYCTPTSTHTMNATALGAPSTGTWTLESGTGTISDINDPAAEISGLGVGANVFRWTLNNGPCEVGAYFDEVTVFIYDENQLVATAGDDQSFCFNPVIPVTATMDGNTPIDPAQGTWTIVQGGGAIQNANDPNTEIIGIPVGINIYQWTIDNGPCDPASISDQVIVEVYNNAQPAASAGDDQFLCSDLPETSLDGSSVTTPGSGQWTLISGSADIADPSDPNTAVTNVALGINVFEWTVDNGPCVPSTTSDQMTITVNEGAVTLANAGADQSICSSTAAVTMAANQPVFPASGQWTVISGSGTFADDSDNTTQITGLSIGENVFRWTLNNGACSGFTTDDVSVFVFDDNAPNAVAGPNQELCTPNTSTTFAADPSVFPAVGTWSLISGTGTVDDPNDPTSSVSGLSIGENVFRWTINNAPCAPATTFDEVSIFVFDGDADAADAGVDQSFCFPVTSTTLSANAVVFPATGQWTLVSGSGSILTPNNPITQVTGLGLGDNVFQWTINQAPCATASTEDQVTITIFDNTQTEADAGEDQAFCSPQNSTALEGNTADFPASGQWTLISGSGTITDPSDPTTTVTDLGLGTNVFEWTISNGPCSPATTSDHVSILVFNSDDDPAAAGPDQDICLPTASVFLVGNVPTSPSIGEWTLISGGGSILDPSNPSTQVTGLAVGENIFRWTISNGDCGAGGTSDDVSIFLYSNASPSAMAGTDQNLCTPQTSTTLAGNSPIFPASGTWTLVSGAGDIADASDPLTEVTNLAIGENIFQWTLDNGPCPGALTQDQVSIFVFDGGAPQPEAGDDQELCTPTTFTFMDADAAIDPGVGTWSLVSGTGNILEPNNPATQITGLTTGINTFVWTLDYATCGLQQDTVRLILYDSTVDPANAGANQQFCSPTSDATLDATPVTAPGFGTWSLFSGNGVIDDVNDPNASVSNLTIGENIFVWTVDNGTCLAEEFTTDTVSIFIFDENQIAANAGDDQEICTPQDAVFMNGNEVTFPAIGTWSIVSGSGTIVDANDPFSEITDLAVGETILEWTISNGDCPGGASSDQVSIFIFDENQQDANAGLDQEFCTPVSAFNLDGNAVTYPASGEWVLLSGSATIADSTDPNTLVTDLAVGENIFQWTVSNGPCTNATTADVVSIFVFNQFNEVANAGADQELCTPQLTTNLEGNAPIFPASGLWTLVSGQGNITNPADPTSEVTNLGVGANVFQWTVSNGPCANDGSMDNVTIFVFDENAELANAGDDQEFCSPVSTTFLAGNAAADPGEGTWTLISGTGNITDINDPNTEVTGLSIGENIFEWSLYNGPCATSGSTDLVSIFIFDEDQEDANAGADQQVCTPLFSTTLDGNAITFPATGSWSVIEGTAVVLNPEDPNSLVDNLSLGDNVFVWTVDNGPCANGITQDTVVVQLFDNNAAISDAGPDQEFCFPNTTATMAANEVFNATIGTWSFVQGSGNILEPNAHNTVITNLDVGENQLIWSVDNGLCGTSVDTVSIFIFDPAAVAADAGPNQEFCTPISTTNLAGNTPDTPGVGTWTLLTGTGTIDSPNDPNTEVSGLTIGENIFCWTIYNGPCDIPTQDCVSIFIYDENAPDSDAGDDQEICIPNQQVLLNAEAPIFPAIGTWSFVEGSGNILDVYDPNSLVTDLTEGTNLIEWIVDNNPCAQGVTRDTVEIRVFFEEYTQADAGEDQEFCSPISTTVLEGSPLDDPTTGTWSLVGGDGVVSNPDDPNSLVSGLTVGINEFSWEVYNGPCDNDLSIDTVAVYIFDQNQEPADAGDDQELCLPINSTFVQANVPITPATGQWSLLSGSGTITEANNSTTEITGLELGINTFVWTVDNGPCDNAISSDTLSITVFEEDAAPADAGADILLCTPTSEVSLGASTPSIPTTGTWSIVSGNGTIDDVNNPNATISGLTVGETVLQWTIYNGPCANNNSFDFVSIQVFDATAAEANAGEDQEWCAPVDEVILEGNDPVFPAIGTWNIISGTGQLSDSNDPNAILSNIDVGTIELTWTVDNGVCNEPAIDTVQVRIYDPMSPDALAGPDQEFCSPFIGTNLEGNEVIAPAFGTWSVISGSATITEPNIPTTSVFDLGWGENILVWSVYNGACENSLTTDTVSLFLNDLSVAAANAGPDLAFCGALDSLQLAGSETVGNTAFGTWNILEGGGDFANVNNEFTYVYDLPVGLHVYEWTVDNGFCGISTDTMEIVIYDPEIPEAFAGIGEDICEDDFLIFNLDGSFVEFPASGEWVIEEGPIEISDPTDPGATVFDLGDIFVPLEDIVSTLIWNVDNGVCGTSADTITYVLSDCLTIEVPDAFSPNGDGINDEFVIPNLFKYPDNTFKVFNRWGAQVYEAAPYNNDWDGRDAMGAAFGNELPVSTYYYILDLGDGTDPVTGYIYLKR